jgi:hypothetical protein
MEQQNNLIRLDRNFAHNPNVFSLYGEDENLVKSLLVYFCENYQKDIFGYTRLDPVKFAKALGYKSKSALQTKVKEPYQAQIHKLKESDIRKMKESGEDLYLTRIENALYKMMALNIMFQNKAGTYKDGHFVKIESMRILKNCTIYTDRTNRDKKFYDVMLDDDLIENLTHYFEHLKKDCFIKAREANLSNLYLYMLNLRELCLNKDEKGTPKFNDLITLAKIADTYTPKDKKRYLKKKLEKLLAIDPDLDFKLKFEAQGEHDFKPVISFNGAKESKEQKARRINEEKLVICKNYIDRNLLSYFQIKYPEYCDSEEYTMLKFEEWNKALETDKGDKLKEVLGGIKKFFPNKYPHYIKYPNVKDVSVIYLEFFTKGRIMTAGLF